jgi:hypothetical protein
VVRPGWLRNLVRREGPGDQQVLNHPVNPGHGNPTSGETLDQPRTGIIGPMRLRAAPRRPLPATAGAFRAW